MIICNWKPFITYLKSIEKGIDYYHLTSLWKTRNDVLWHIFLYIVVKVFRYEKKWCFINHFYFLLKNRVHFRIRCKQRILLPFANPATGHKNHTKYDKYYCHVSTKPIANVLLAFTILKIISVLTSASTFQIILPCPLAL